MLWRAREAIVALGGGRPLVLLVDDAHLLDDASATLVHQLVATRSAFVIATVRTGEAGARPDRRPLEGRAGRAAGAGAAERRQRRGAAEHACSAGR